MKLLKYFAYTLFVALMVACQGTGDPYFLEPENTQNNPNNNNPDNNNPDNNNPDNNNPDNNNPSGYTLSVDKTTIEADGLDAATFTLTDASGKNLVDDPNELSYIYFKNTETGESLPRRTKKFSMPGNGVYTFSATYQGKASNNTVTITVQNREKYERYFQTVALMKCTGTWCGPCAVMANYLENVSEPWREHMAIIAAHASSGSYDPFASYSNELGTTLLNMFGGSGYPFLIYDATKTQQGSSGGSSTIEEEIRGFLTNHPATCGVAIRSTELTGTTLKIRAAMTSSTGGEYDMGYILLVDNQPYSGGTITSGIYNDIVFGHSSNIVSMNNSTKFSATADQEVEKEWTVEKFPTDSFNHEDVRILVYALSKTAERENIIDNLAICPLGGNVDYRLNK